MQKVDSIYLTKKEIKKNRKLVEITLKKLVKLKNDFDTKTIEFYTMEKLWCSKEMLKVDGLKLILPDFMGLIKDVDAKILRNIVEDSLDPVFSEEEIFERLSFMEQAFIIDGVREKARVSRKSILELRKELVEHLYSNYKKKNLDVDSELRWIEKLQRHLDLTDDLYKKLSQRGNELLRLKMD